MPDRMKARAVLAFIVVRPGRTLFKEGMSLIQPTSTRRPTMNVAALPVCDRELSEKIERVPVWVVMTECVISSASVLLDYPPSFASRYMGE